jgi:secondary thiamine-phosphate synthase enzyme
MLGPGGYDVETLAHTSAFRQTTIRIETQHPTQFIDLTDEVTAFVIESRVRTGLVNVQGLHTTTALVVNEHDPLLLSDVTALLERIAPQDGLYRHDNVSLRTSNCVLTDRPNGHSHCRALLLAPSVSLNIAGGRLQLGTWQRIFLVELDGPRTRSVSVVAIGEAEP